MRLQYKILASTLNYYNYKFNDEITIFIIQTTHTLSYPSFLGESPFILSKKGLYEHGNSCFISNIVITLFI